MARKKIIYEKRDLLGSKAHQSEAMRDIVKKDKAHVLNRKEEKEQLFQELKECRDNGVTEEELKDVLARLKYGEEDHFTREEINDLAQELGVGEIEKKHILS